MRYRSKSNQNCEIKTINLKLRQSNRSFIGFLNEVKTQLLFCNVKDLIKSRSCKAVFSRCFKSFFYGIANIPLNIFLKMKDKGVKKILK